MTRKLPQINPDTRAFWQSGADGILMIHRCRDCERWVHPPAPVCPRCTSLEVAPQAACGTGRVLSMTVNHHAWNPDLTHPYVVAIVELDDQPGLRVLSNIVGAPVDAVAIGQPVRVVFEQHEDVWLPLFEPLP